MPPDELARIAAVREYTALGLLALIIIVGAIAMLYFAKILIMAHVKTQAEMVAGFKAGFDRVIETVEQRSAAMLAAVESSKGAQLREFSRMESVILDVVTEKEQQDQEVARLKRELGRRHRERQDTPRTDE